MKLFHQFVSVNASLLKSENNVVLFFLSFSLTVAWHVPHLPLLISAQ